MVGRNEFLPVLATHTVHSSYLACIDFPWGSECSNLEQVITCIGMFFPSSFRLPACISHSFVSLLTVLQREFCILPLKWTFGKVCSYSSVLSSTSWVPVCWLNSGTVPYCYTVPTPATRYPTQLHL